MDHLFEARDPINRFEGMLKNAFVRPGVDAIWVRYVQQPGQEKTELRMIWLQLARKSPVMERAIMQLARELQIRTLNAPFATEFHVLYDDLPPAVIAPSCIWRRT